MDAGLDLTIQMRMMDLLLKMLKHDLNNVPSYGYAIQKPPAMLWRGDEKPLVRSTPEEEGVSSVAVKRYFDALSAHVDNLGIHGVIMLRHGKVIAEGHYAPYHGDVPHMLYSASKSIVGTAIGMAVDEGLLSLDEHLIDIFPGVTPYSHEKVVKNYTLWHLLTMSTGVRFNEVGSMLDADWVKMFMESMPKFEAGSDFEYNSLNTYMLAAVLQKRTGQTVTEFLAPRLYEPLGIAHYYWETCPQHIEKGGWGLSLRLEDLAKIGQLYLNGGLWEGRRLLSEEWVKAATSRQIATPKAEMKNGYGYQIWLSDNDGNYQFNGAFGQYVMVLPRHDAVVAIYSGSASLFAQGPLQTLTSNCFFADSDTPLPENKAAYLALQDTLNSLVFSPSMDDGLACDGNAFSEIAVRLDGREYYLNKNTGGIFPMAIQAVHGNYSSGATLLRFESKGEGIAITIYEHGEKNTIYLCGDGGISEDHVAHRGEWHVLGTQARWQLTDENMRIGILASFIETPSTRVITLTFTGDQLEMSFDELPGVADSTRMLLDLVGINTLSMLRKLLPMVQRDQPEVQLRAMMMSRANGALVMDNPAMISYHPLLGRPRIEAAEGDEAGIAEALESLRIEFNDDSNEQGA